MVEGAKESFMQAKVQVGKMDNMGLFELAQMVMPAPAIAHLAEALCRVFGVENSMKVDKTTQESVPDWWSPCKDQMFKKPADLKKMIAEYDMEKLTNEVAEKVKEILGNPACTQEKMDCCSMSGAILRKWVEALVLYHASK